ncbi:MAG TPA: glucuronate isomerase [Gemmatimonadales bacterium]|nr:glucuronate isomerase [Gemmatimonadales bacterium]
MADRLILHEDRFFDPDTSVRRVARTLYEETRRLPIISPHGHVDPRLLAENTPFPEPTSSIVRPDHYILRLLYARGLPLEGLLEGDPRAAWRLFAEHYYLFQGTPTGAWLDYELHQVFGIDERLDGETADRTYDAIAERLRSPEFLPRALFERFDIEVLATTDKASDRLDHHRAIRESGWGGRVIPCFRPDAVFKIAARGWPAELEALGREHGTPLVDYAEFVAALEDRRLCFRELGATATDHAVVDPYTNGLRPEEAEALFQLARQGKVTAADERRFEGHLLMEMARMSLADGLVMQIHAGAFRNHNAPLYERFGPDRGGDIPVATEFTRNLRPLLNACGNDQRLTLVLFTLDESTYSRELAPLAGHYPAVRLGAPWWFQDSLEGMTRFRRRTTETASIYKTAGFNDDTRAFCSIPARHDLARRVDASYLAGLVARHVITLDDARRMARALAYDLAKETYKLWR